MGYPHDRFGQAIFVAGAVLATVSIVIGTAFGIVFSALLWR